jgi:hypothetical protein
MTRMSRTLLALPIVFALALPAAPALAATTTTGTSGYYQTPPKQASGTGPSKETSKPRTTTSPASSTPSTSTASTPTSPTTTASHATTLPFTGLDLRWIVGFGALLIVAGLSIQMTQRRRRHAGR